MRAEPVITTINEPIYAIGLSTRTNMKNVFKDLPRLYKQYMSYQEMYIIPEKKTPWEYVSLSRNFDKDQSFEYLTGHVVTVVNKVPEVFSPFVIPAGTYVVFSIKPKHKLMLGLAISKAKRYIYNKWMKKSQYEFAGLEFEYNNEVMFKNNPNHIDLYVSVKEKDDKVRIQGGNNDYS